MAARKGRLAEALRLRVREETHFPTDMNPAHYAEDLNRLFERREIDLRVAPSDFLFAPEYVTDAHRDRRLSGFLTGKFSAPIHEGEFYHYTSAVGLEKIIESNVLRLTSLQKRATEDEVKIFLRRFGYSYPLQTDPETNAPRYLTSIAPRIFYLSLTESAAITATKDGTLWNSFAGNDGARLKLRMKLQSGNLRRMMYGDQVDELADVFREVTEITQRVLGKPFFWADAGIVCALQLPFSYETEEEIRLIARRDTELPSGRDGGTEYLEVKLGYTPQMGLEVDLVEIQTNRLINPPAGVSVIRRS